MTLEDLLAVTDEETPIYVSCGWVYVTYYDGKHSINEKYNNWLVSSIWASDSALNVEICDRG